MGLFVVEAKNTCYNYVGGSMKYEIDGIRYDVIVQRKKIKNIYIRFKDNTIYVNTSFITLKHDINKLLNDNITTLRKMIKRDEKKCEDTFLGQVVDIVGISNLKHPEYGNGKLFVKDRSKIDEAYKYLALPIFKKRLDYIYESFKENIPYPTLKIRKMTSRWGVCNRRNTSITLNLELIKWDIMYIDYVIVHELSHFVHFDHSQAFWSLVAVYVPNYKTLRKKLRE